MNEPFESLKPKILTMSDSMWSKLREEATSLASRERILSKILTELILERESLSDALSWRLSSRLAKGSVPEDDLRGLFRKSLESSEGSYGCDRSRPSCSQG